MYKQEQMLKEKGFQCIAGVDEAGRGPLAGPVVAAAVILPSDYKHTVINDSKQLTALQREQLFVEIKNVAISYAVGVISPSKIDDMGILNATKLAMRQAILKLDPTPDFILTDAVPVNIMDIPQMPIIKGDQKVFSIAAASIIAKVHRDHLMAKYDKKYPNYSFGDHMGYGTEVHMSAIKKHGPCPIHRLTFSPFSG
ncbi:ribonuclease HII [Patescibacteria group bacterium]|nr:ribonuclease HII [Patescibacteria group bacterium]MBU1683076.1 ribonuclease HII [Patescibacteria group bacterium]MBU1935163.1 ribonuclease HII [Patescibacteria group bacterium]